MKVTLKSKLLAQSDVNMNMQFDTAANFESANVNNEISINSEQSAESDNGTSIYKVLGMNSWMLPVNSKFKSLLIDHSYFMQPIENCAIAHNHTYKSNGLHMRSRVVNDHTYMTNAPELCDINTIDCNHSAAYELRIRQTLQYSYFSCKRLLYEDQVNYFSETNVLGAYYCQYCKNKLQNNKIPVIGYTNEMDPGKIPSALSQLNCIERRFVAMINVFMTLYVLPGNFQLGERGMAINFPASPSDFIAKLDDVPIMQVMFESKKDEGWVNKIKHYIRPSRIYQALHWLKANNPLYTNIKLPENNPDHHASTFAGDIYLEETMAVFDTTSNPKSVESLLNTANVPSLNVPLCKDQPLYAYDLDHGEELAFPWLFCLGKAGYKQNRAKSREFDSMFLKPDS